MPTERYSKPNEKSQIPVARGLVGQWLSRRVRGLRNGFEVCLCFRGRGHRTVQFRGRGLFANLSPVRKTNANDKPFSELFCGLS